MSARRQEPVKLPGRGQPSVFETLMQGGVQATPPVEADPAQEARAAEEAEAEAKADSEAEAKATALPASVTRAIAKATTPRRRVRNRSGSQETATTGNAREAFFMSAEVIRRVHAAADEVVRDLNGMLTKAVVLDAMMESAIANKTVIRDQLRTELLRSLGGD